MSATDDAFKQYRQGRVVRRCHHGSGAELDQMTDADGLTRWADGPLAAVPPPRGGRAHPHPRPPLNADQTRLWVIRAHDVVTAPERCGFAVGRDLASGRIKHSNLTGGAEAHCGGELLQLSEDTLLLSCASGRYPVADETELMAAMTAFRNSGYAVWYLGYDKDLNQPVHFEDAQNPEWLE